MLKEQRQLPFAAEATLVNEIQALYDSQSGFYGPEHLIYGRNLNLHISVLLGLAAANNPVPQEAIAALERRQAPDGGWSLSSGGASDIEVTALAVQALVAVDTFRVTPVVLDKAKAFLLSQQNQDGGFPHIKRSQCCAESNAVSTAFAVQALIPLGTAQVDLDAISTAIGFLRSLQRDSGAFADKLSQPEESLGATYHVVPALLGVSFASPLSISGANPGQPIPGMPSLGARGENSPPFAWFFSVAAFLLILGLVVRRAGRRPGQVRSTRYTTSPRIRH
ncbi:MAG TPA: prenyltransferase/squalene oxidase repeat-containing protein [Chloroflexia bacterium]|nr:prenyltransferase/squalene oxidase repeat-containing protein [Chloroflexia bacterium]